MSKKGFIEKFLNGKGFYVALGVCMVAIGISAWSEMSGISNTQTDTSSGGIASVNQKIEEPTNKTESNIEDTRSESKTTSSPKSSSVTSDTQTEKTPVAKFFTYPVVGEIIKKFSNSELQYSVTYNDMRIHTGLDIKAAMGVSVKSAGEGKVISVEKDPDLGYTVKINHGNKIIGVYAGLSSSVSVKKGDIVKSGTNLGPLATVSNECLDAPHLHLEFLKDNKPIDPMTLISK